MGKTLREILEVDRDNTVDISHLASRREINKFFHNMMRTKRNIVVRYAEPCQFRGPLNGRFAGGKVKSYEHVDQMVSHLWLDTTNFSIGLDDIYDVYVRDGKEDKKDYPKKDWKLFEFRAESSGTEESSFIIHADPYLAYVALRKGFKDSSVVQNLLDIRPVKLGPVSHYTVEHKD